MKHQGKIALILGIALILLLGFVIVKSCVENKTTGTAASGVTENQTEADPSATEVTTEALTEAATDAQADTTESTTEEEMPEAYQISDFPEVIQTPELPTGCEITALTMVLNYYGFGVDKVTMARDYLPTLASTGVYTGEDGRTYGNDMNEYFIGNPFTVGGIICGTGAIMTAADTYLEDQGSSMRAEDWTGAEPEDLYELVSQDTPVVVWCTIEMADRGVPEDGIQSPETM